MAALGQAFLDLYAQVASWLNQGSNLAIVIGVLALALLYIVFRKRG
jgi:LPXTG-motif cell wall-anchored protein